MRLSDSYTASVNPFPEKSLAKGGYLFVLEDGAYVRYECGKPCIVPVEEVAAILRDVREADQGPGGHSSSRAQPCAE